MTYSKLTVYSTQQEKQSGNVDQKFPDSDQCFALNRELLRIQEIERQRIARDLHDVVGQALLTVKLGLNMIFTQYPEFSDHEDVPVLRSNLAGAIHKAVRAVRDMTYTLRPPDLDQLGLPLAVSALCTDFKERCGFEIDFLSAGLERIALGFETETNLYRLTQEALSNVEKHALATKVMVRLVASHPNVILRVTDNGQGFEVGRVLAAAQAEKRLGLWSMFQRAKLLGGEVRLSSTLGVGTSVVVEIPQRGRGNGNGLAHTPR